jgi:hypothetical protein
MLSANAAVCWHGSAATSVWHLSPQAQASPDPAAPHQQLRPGFTPEPAPEPWYGAESALVVTALSHTQVCSVAGCQAVAVPLRPEGHCG